MLMKISRYLGALAFVGVSIPYVALAGPPPVISSSVAVCNPNAPSQCAAPNSSGALPVSLSSSAGATAILVPTGLAANGITPIASASAESCHVFKSSPGNVYGLSGYIGAAGFIYIQNLAAAPTNGAIVPYVAPIYVGAAGSWSWTPPTGAPVLFTAGITVCASSTGPLTLTLYSTNTVFSGIFQ